MRSRRVVVVSMAVVLLAVGGNLARAEDACLTGFGGFTYWLNFQQLSPISGLSTGPITGRVTGGATCGTGGNGIPLDGSASIDGNNLNIGFQVHAVDIPACGSVEYKVILNLTTLRGPLDLFNTRNEFDNTGTVTLGPCPSAPAPSAPLVPGAVDDSGNTQGDQ